MFSAPYLCKIFAEACYPRPMLCQKTSDVFALCLLLHWKNCRATDTSLYIYIMYIVYINTFINDHKSWSSNDGSCFSSACIVHVFGFLILDIQWVDAMARNRRRKENENWVSEPTTQKASEKKPTCKETHMQANKQLNKKTSKPIQKSSMTIKDAKQQACKQASE